MRSPFRTQTISRAHKRRAPALRPGPFCVGKPGSGHSARDLAAYTPSMRIAEEGACPFLHPRKRRVGGFSIRRPRPCGRDLRASANREAGTWPATLRRAHRRCGLPRKGVAPSGIPESDGLGGIFHPKDPALRPGPSRIGKPGSGHSARDLAAYTPPLRIPEEGACPFRHPRKRRIGGDFPSEGPGLAAGAFARRQTGKRAFGPRPCGVHTAAVDS